MTVAAFRRPIEPAPAAAPAEFAVRLERVTKRFPVRQSWKSLIHGGWGTRENTTVLRAISLSVSIGEFFGVLGPNGAGKTTLFKILSSSLQPDEGSAAIFGRDTMRHADDVRHAVGCVFANDRTLYWRLSARENLRLYAALAGLRHGEAERRIAELLNVVDLEGAGDKMAATYSSGMRQRLLIARALLTRPRLLLLDEPTRSLDPISARNFRDFLRAEIAARHECTVVLATHTQEEAMEYCDRVAVLNRGELLAVGTTDDLKQRVSNQKFVAWIRDLDPEVIGELLRRRVVADIHIEHAGDPGWSRLEMSIGGGIDSAIGVVRHLSVAGAAVGRFEMVQMSLADLIDRIVARGAQGST